MDHPDLLALAARMACATNQPDRAASLMQEALLEGLAATDPERRAELLATLYSFAWEAQDFETSTAAIEEAYLLVETADASRSKEFVLLYFGWYRWSEGRLRASLRLFEEVMAMSEELGDDSAWATGASAAAHSLADLGWASRAGAMVDRSMERVTDFDEGLESMGADVDRAIALWTAGRFADAARIATSGLARATRYGLEARLGSGFRGCLADLFFELGRYDDVATVTKPGIAGDGIQHTIAWAALTMARAVVVQGRLAEAHRLVDDIRPEVAVVGAFLPLSLVELARADGQFDDVVSAVDAVIDGRERAERVIPLPMLLGAGIGAGADRAVAARRRRKAADAAVATDAARRWLLLFRSLVAATEAEGGAGPFIEALLATAEAEMTRLEGHSDPAAWSDAVARWGALAHPHQGAYARMRLVEATLDSKGERGDVTTVLQEAHGTALLLGAVPLRQRSRSSCAARSDRAG